MPEPSRRPQEPPAPEPTPTPEPAPLEEAGELTVEPAEASATPGSPAEKPPSNLDLLRSQYETARADRRETIPIAPGRFNGNLAAKYKPIPWSDTRKSARRAAKGGLSEENELNYAAGQLAKACETILFRAVDGGELEPIHLAAERFKDGSPIRYDERLCEILGIEVTPGLSTEQIVRLVFLNEHALDAHYMRFDAWLKEIAPGDEDDEDESEGRERPT